MAIQDILDKVTEVTASGQPANATSHDAVEREEEKPNASVQQDSTAEGGETTDGGTEQSDVSTTETPPNEVVPVKVDLSPDALRQITNLSAGNRKLKAQIKELETKIKEVAAPEDVKSKLERLALLESALTSPRKWLELSKKTLEDVAADTLASDNEVTDPRVDELKTQLADVNKKLADLDAGKQTEQQRQQQAQISQRTAAGIKSIEDKIKSEAGQERWVYLQDNADAAKNAFEATLKVYQRDYYDPETKTFKDIKPEETQKIIEMCLDKAEALLVAEEVLADRKKNGGHSLREPVQRKGIEFRDTEPAPTDLRRQPPKPTIDGTRGPTSSLRVPRGPTDVRTARARAMAIATSKTGE